MCSGHMDGLFINGTHLDNTIARHEDTRQAVRRDEKTIQATTTKETVMS